MFAIARSSSTKKRVLGVSLGDRALSVAEVVWNGAGPKVVRAAELRYPAGVSLENGAAGLGEALKQLLRERGFVARAAVVGVPARWLISRGQQVPPADEETASAILRLRGEAESAAELGEMVFDYAGRTSESAASSVLLVGLPRRRVSAIVEMATAAGLKVAAVTATALALADATADVGMVLSARADGAELVAKDGGQVRVMRHLGSATNGAGGAGFVAELRRAGAVLAAGGQGGGDGLVVWDEVGLGGEAVGAIGAAVGTAATVGTVGMLGASVEVPENTSSAAAVALALAGNRRAGQGAVDFLHPRIVPPATGGVSRRTVWLSTAAAVVVLIGAVAWADLAKLERQVAETEQQLKQLDPAYKLAKPFVADMKFVESFAGGGPRDLACLRDVTAALPEGGTAYLTGFLLKANMQGELMGRASTSQDVLNLLEKLNAGGRFAGLRRKIDARGTGNDVSFMVTFTYVPAAAGVALNGEKVTDLRTPG